MLLFIFICLRGFKNLFSEHVTYNYKAQNQIKNSLLHNNDLAFRWKEFTLKFTSAYVKIKQVLNTYIFNNSVTY